MLEPAKKIGRHLVNESRQFKGELQERSLSYVIAGLGVVAGLAWNDAIQSLIVTLLPNDSNSLWAKFLYAFLVTVVVVLITVYLTRLFKKKEC